MSMLKSFSAATAVCLIAAVANADTVIYEQLPGAGSTHAYISSTLNNSGGTPGFQAADDFQLSSSQLITGINWWGESNSGGDNFLFTFYANSAGLPGAVLHTTGGSLATSVANPGSPFDPVVFYESEFANPFSAAAGTTYWVSVFNAAADASWLWLSADLNGNGSVQGQVPTPSWFSNVSNLSFQLTVPEPGSLTVLPLIALAAASCSRFRRRRLN